MIEKLYEHFSVVRNIKAKKQCLPYKTDKNNPVDVLLL